MYIDKTVRNVTVIMQRKSNHIKPLCQKYPCVGIFFNREVLGFECVICASNFIGIFGLNDITSIHTTEKKYRLQQFCGECKDKLIKVCLDLMDTCNSCRTTSIATTSNVFTHVRSFKECNNKPSKPNFCWRTLVKNSYQNLEPHKVKFVCISI